MEDQKRGGARGVKKGEKWKLKREEKRGPPTRYKHTPSITKKSAYILLTKKLPKYKIQNPIFNIKKLKKNKVEKKGKNKKFELSLEKQLTPSFQEAYFYNKKKKRKKSEGENSKTKILYIIYREKKK